MWISGSSLAGKRVVSSSPWMLTSLVGGTAWFASLGGVTAREVEPEPEDDGEESVRTSGEAICQSQRWSVADLHLNLVKTTSFAVILSYFSV